MGNSEYSAKAISSAPSSIEFAPPSFPRTSSFCGGVVVSKALRSANAIGAGGG